MFGLVGGFTKPTKFTRYATFESLPGRWDQFPGLGALWCRVLEHVEEARTAIRRPCW